MKLHFRETGAGEPLLILHGLFGMLDNWNNIAAKLGESFRVITADFRNHGRSPHHPAFDLRVMSEDVLALASDLALSQFHLLGHSLGGKVAMQLAADNPMVIRKLVVADMSPREYSAGHAEVFQALHALPLDQLHNRNDALERMLALLPDETTVQFLLKSLYRDAEGRYRWRFNLEAISEGYQHIQQAPILNAPVMVPALFLRGSESNYITSSDEALIQHWFPQANIETIANAGHWLHADQPEAFVQSVRKFLNPNHV
jgi:pimeloyl-ACP methyl ester carboxylesterase